MDGPVVLKEDLVAELDAPDIEEYELTTDDPPDGIVDKLDLDKIIEYFRTKTQIATDALERLIVELRATWDEERLAPFVEALDTSREHLAGFHQPMVWLTEAEAKRYVEKHNRWVERSKLAHIEHSPNGILVVVPK